MPCFEDEVKDKIKVPPAIVKSFTDKVLEHLSVGRSYPEALAAVSEEAGLKQGTVNSILRRDPQTFRIAKHAIVKAGKVRMVRNAAEGFAEQLKNDGKLASEPGNIAKAWDVQRRLALAGHSPVFPWTHMRNWAVQIPTAAGRARMGMFWRSAMDVWRYGGQKGRAIYEMDMALMQMGDRYDFFKTSGADIVPGKRTPGDILLQNRKPSWQTRNFDRLKIARYEALDDVWSRLDPALRSDPATAEAMGAMFARDLNYATGSVMPPAGEAANMLAKTAAQLSQTAGHYNLLLSSKLFFAKHMDAWLTPLRYVAKGGRATVAERAARNVALGRWANTVAAHLSILGVNYAFNKLMGWQTPNLTTPTKSDFLRIRLGNFVVPFSPMLEALRLPIVFTASMVTKGSDEAGNRLWRALWNAAHPSLHTVYEQSSGKDYMGRPVPSIRNLISPIKSTKAPVSVTEYVTTRSTPIAISGGLREFYQALRDHGVDAGMATAFIKGAVAAATSGLAGTHVYEEQPKPKRSHKKAKPVHIPLTP